MELTSYKKQNCADGKECKKFGCGFFHPYGRRVGKDCRNGAECRGHSQGWCYFHHPATTTLVEKIQKKATISNTHLNLLATFSHNDFPPLTAREQPTMVIEEIRTPSPEPEPEPEKKVSKKPPYWKDAREYNEKLWIFINSKGHTYKTIKKLGDDEYLSQNKIYSKLYQEYRKLFVDWRKRKNGKPTAMPRKCNIDYTALRQKEIDMGC